ncbi:MAG: 5-formyltetrahydrofolate cyclo-ligase [Actinomycetia bacterium]|nr:5-formyltetrahydrofolate cyclo-ligase [Actinomycetes bacterium]
MEQPGGGPRSDPADPSASGKQRHRTVIRANRTRRPAAERAAFAERLATWTPPEETRRLSCFVGVGDEPDTRLLIAALTGRGIEVLLPITLSDFSLDWAVYTGDRDLVDARYGLREPTGPRLGQAALADVDVVLVPALAVDAEGRRLGQGAGCYDRALIHVSSQTPVLAVVFDDERLTEQLPEEPHDRRVDGVLF